MSFQWINHLNRVLAALLLTVLSSGVAANSMPAEVGPTEYEYLFSSVKARMEHQDFLEKKYKEFDFLHDYQRSSEQAVAGMIGDDCQFADSNITVSGKAKMAIEGQEALLEADKITYEKVRRLVEATGKVKICKNGTVTAGSALKFKIDSPDYLMNSDRVFVILVEAKKRSDVRFKTSAKN